MIRKYLMKYLWHRYKTAYRKRLIELPYTPREVWLEPTNHCNLRCIMCLHGKGLKSAKGYMDMVLYAKVLGELKVMRVQRVNLFLGGESLLHKNIVKMVEMARDARVQVRLHTNATILSEELARKLLESNGLEEISFSFDGEEKGYYERVRVNAKFDRTLANIRRFLEIKKGMGLRPPRVLVQVIKEKAADGSAPVISDSFKSHFAGLPVDKFHPVCFHNFGGTLDAGGEISYELDREHYSPCRQPWRSMSIAWDGEVVGCCIDMEKKLVLGDLKVQTVAEVWNGEAMKAFRKALAEGCYRDIELCKDCDQLWL